MPLQSEALPEGAGGISHQGWGVRLDTQEQTTKTLFLTPLQSERLYGAAGLIPKIPKDLPKIISVPLA